MFPSLPPSYIQTTRKSEPNNIKMVAQLGMKRVIIARAIVLTVFCPLWTLDQLTHQPLLEIELIVYCLQPSLYQECEPGIVESIVTMSSLILTNLQ